MPLGAGLLDTTVPHSPPRNLKLFREANNRIVTGALCPQNVLCLPRALHPAQAKLHVRTEEDDASDGRIPARKALQGSGSGA